MQSYFPKIPLLLSALLLVLSCLGFLFLYRTINNINSESLTLEQEWQNEAQKRNEIKELEHSIKSAEVEIAQLEKHFAKGKDVVPFLDTVEALAAKVGVEAEVTSVAIMQDHTGLSVGVRASGTFNNLYKFITLLENSPYVLEFIAVDMRKESAVEDPTGKGTTVPGWSSDLRLKLLSFIE